MRPQLTLILCLILFAFVVSPAFGQKTGTATDFAHDVVPILQKHCVGCHGGREAKVSFSINTRELLVESDHVQVGKAAESHLIKLILSTDKEVQMPPSDQARLTASEVDTLKSWIADGIPWEDGFSFAPVAYDPPLKPRRPDLPPVVEDRTNPIDRILDADMAAHQVLRPKRVDDATFLRRASLDLVGLLPTPEALTAFVGNPATGKREEIVRRLLDDRIGYADHWLTFFNDLLRNDYSGTGFITGGRQQISTWLYDALLTNRPFDQFARDLIAPPTPASQGYIDGIRWRGEVSAGQTVEIQFAQSISQSFLGINMKCASCHDSFIDRWKLDESYGLAAIYASAPMEIHRCDKPIGRQAQAKWLFPELGTIDPAATKEERLQQLAALMTHPDNGRFTRTIANRLWYKLMGRGIVHPLDAMQTRPWNEDLLDALAMHLQDHQYDLKSVLYLIATSEAYQSECVVRAKSSDSAMGEFIYRGPIARRMTAEQFLDGVWQMTGSAPAAFDAQIARAIINGTQADEVALIGEWIWGDSAANGKVPAAGETISIRKKVILQENVISGGGFITCDNSFVMFVNGRKVESGNEWAKPHAILLKPLLNKGQNEIVVVASNGGSGPNAAGLFFEARLKLENGDSVTVASDASWEWNANTPASNEARLGAIKGAWKPVVVVPAISPWTSMMSASGKPLMLQSIKDDLRMTRTSLLKSDFLMRSLGRPMREQIVSMRPSEVTTLEAVDLTNGAALSTYLVQGANRIADRWSDDKSGLINHLMEFALSRQPTNDERTLMETSLSEKPTPQEIEDLLWAVFMMPEFMLIR